MDKNKEIIKTIKSQGYDIIVQDNLDGGYLYELGDASSKDEWAHIYKLDLSFVVYFNNHNKSYHFPTIEDAEKEAVNSIIQYRIESENQ